MQNLPVETLIQVFRLACTDGGYTGCSLSQTSRAVRDASQSVRFSSVALSINGHRLESFLTAYQTLSVAESGARAKIVHLFLEDHREDENKQMISEEREGSGDDDAPNCSQALKLLHLVADDLESLALPSKLMSPDIQLGHRAFTSLRALVVNVSRDFYWTALEASVIPVLFPVLTHVYMRMAPASFAVGPFFHWNGHAPGTTHLRLSYCPLLGTALEDIRLLLGTPSYPHKMGRRPVPVHPPPTTREWPSLSHIAIQPLSDPSLSGMPYGNSGLIYWNFRSELSWMAEWANRENVVDVQVLKPITAKRASTEARARVRQAWERLVSSGVDSDWLTLGESEEDEGLEE